MTLEVKDQPFSFGKEKDLRSQKKTDTDKIDIGELC